jgi:hypothetical protein
MIGSKRGFAFLINCWPGKTGLVTKPCENVILAFAFGLEKNGETCRYA